MLSSLRSSQTLSRLLRHLPGQSSLFGPPRRVAETRDYNGFSRPLKEVTPKRPLGIVTSPGQPGSGSLRASLPPVLVGDLPGGRLLWPDGSIVTADDTLLRDTSFWTLCDDGGLHRHPLGSRWRAPRQRRVSGSVLALTSDFANASFGHYVLDALPRLDYLLRAGRSLAEFDAIVLPSLRSPTLDQLCTALHLPPERIVRFTDVEDLVCDHLTFVTFPGWPGNYPADTPCFYRRLLSLPATPGHRRLYLSRQNQKRRRLCNATQVEAVLARHGFETVFPETDPDTIRKCSEAGIIVGIEGSNLVNQIFAPPGGAIVLLVDDHWSDLPYACSLAAACGKRFIPVLGEARNIPANPQLRWANPHDLHVPTDALETSLREAVSPSYATVPSAHP
ncbi:MAG: glycosyltransferase family 61 protein [Opitutaceae bacterium]|jgi:hypothetical protein